jgi:two-component system invasion response regulator UvrY
VISILIVDDQAVVRRGVRQTLAEELRDVVFGEARSAEEALRVASKRPWDLITIEPALPNRDVTRDRFELLQELRRQCPQSRILILSMQASQRLATRAMEMGASAYLSKTASLPELCKAVHKVLAGGTYTGRDVTKKTDGAPLAQDDDESPRKALSAREREILAGICSGKSETEIAGELSLDIRTVSTYKRRTLNKLRVTCTTSLIRYAIDHGLT